MSALPQPQFIIRNPQELATYLLSAVSWREIEALTSDYPHWKGEAWALLSESDQERIQVLKKWQDHPIAQKLPPGCLVQRLDAESGQKGTVIDYWSAYGVDYVTFKVGNDVDWCRASNLKRVG